MKAVYIEAYGGREQLKYGDLPRPELRPRDVLIEVHAAAINPVDWKIRNGWLQARNQYEFPLILGWDVAGVVVETGPEVTKFKVGDPVFTRPDIRRNGGYAEYIAVDESLVAPKPANLSFEEAAAVPLAALTAWDALVETAHIAQGQRALIHAGAGGVGIYAIQLAKHFGAHVTTTVSERNVELVKSLGADAVIDYNKQDFSTAGRVYDIVFDTVGGDVQEKSFQVVKTGGILVSIVSPPDQAKCEANGIRGAWFFLEPDGEKLARIGRLIEQGEVRPVVGAVFPLAEVAKAHELSESRHLTGKIVLKVK